MLVEIRNTSFENKGAELMLRSIIAILRDRLPDCGIAMAPRGESAPYVKRAELGLYQKLWYRRCRVQWGYWGGLIPERLRRMYGVVLDSEVDVVLDASGFTYSDQWGADGAVESARCVKKWKRQGAKVIFLPQAFGPFQGGKLRDAFKAIVDGADLIYARDSVSYDYVAALTGPRPNVRLAPDFTNLTPGVLPPRFDRERNRFCVIPNCRMIDKADKSDSERYFSFLVDCVKYLRDRGAKPFFLVHEGAKDLRLSEEIVKTVGPGVNLVREDNALHVKGIIGTCDGMLGSRFHGLVSALSQGVPALAAGWSHKYEMLFRDYGFPEGMLSPRASAEEIRGKIDVLLDERSRQAVQKRVRDAAEEQKRAVVRMWEDVFALLRASKNVEGRT